MDQKIFDKEYYQMLNVIKESFSSDSHTINVRFHPSNNKKPYYGHFPFITKTNIVSDSRVIIGHTSSLLYEALSLGYKVLQYKSKVPTIDLPNEVQFTVKN